MVEIEENKAYYWLSLAGLGAKKLCALLSVYSLAELWDGIKKSSSLEGVLGNSYHTLLRCRSTDFLDGQLESLKRAGIGLLTMADDAYPESLRQKEVCPPAVIYYKGDLEALKKPCLAVVGTRICSQYGKEAAEIFARDLALAGVTVVSGLATGIDTFAHAAALDFGTTAAVLGGGFNYVSPYSQKLFERIAASGSVVLTEYPPAFTPTKYSFPERNRIISGLSLGVIVAEAAGKSGALITADFALEQGREVYAVPGNITNPKSAGCNALIKNGLAAIAVSAADILSDLRLKPALKAKKTTAISLDFFEEKIYNRLQSGEKHFDALSAECGFSANQLSSALFSLEMRGIVKRLPSNNYRLVK